MVSGLSFPSHVGTVILRRKGGLGVWIIGSVRGKMGKYFNDERSPLRLSRKCVLILYSFSYEKRFSILAFDYACGEREGEDEGRLSHLPRD